jgi:hypothetical protein
MAIVPGADGAGDGELSLGVDVAEAGGPAGEVVGARQMSPASGRRVCANSLALADLIR